MNQFNEFRSIDPYNGQLVGVTDKMSNYELNTTIEKAEEVYGYWGRAEIDTRKAGLISLKASILNMESKLAAMITLEMGKPILQSHAEVKKSAKLCDYYIDHLDQLESGREIFLGNGKKALVNYQPQGIILGIMPWNFPVWQVLRFAIPVVASGNVVLLKHASNVMLTGSLIEQVFAESFLPIGVLQLLRIDHKTLEKVISHSTVRGVSLTGSEEAGVNVGSLAGKHLIKSVLELGGNDPFLVTKNADVRIAAKTAAQARLNNNGQTCIAAKRFIIDQSVYDEFLHHFCAEIALYAVGDPSKEDTKISVLARPDLAQKLSDQVGKSVEMGACKLLIGGVDPELPSRYLPEVLINVSSDAPAHLDELFGPVAAVFKASDESDLIRMANQSRYGLGASVWSSDIDQAKYIAKQLDCGSIAINDYLSSDPAVPFGGVKRSGYGREMSAEGYYEFLNCKSIIF